MTTQLMHDYPLDLRPVDDMRFTWHESFATAELPYCADQCWWCEEFYGGGTTFPIVSWVTTSGDPDHTGVIHLRCLIDLRARRRRESAAAAVLDQLRTARANADDPGRSRAGKVTVAVDQHWDVIEAALQTIR